MRTPLDVLRGRFRDRLAGRVRGELATRRALLPPARADLRDLDHQRTALDARLDAVERRLARAGDRLTATARALSAGRPLPRTALGPDTTIEAAWHSSPDAPAVFARHHLPACDGCAVRFDETLAEAADAYELNLDRLLADLRAA